MAILECRSAQRGVESAWVEVENITDGQVQFAWARLDELLSTESQVSSAVALAFIEATSAAPFANPSDLWQHVIYRRLLDLGWSDQRWKRVSGFALERALVALYGPRLSPYGLRLRIMNAAEANIVLEQLELVGTKASKVDLFLEGRNQSGWQVFGAAHAKSSIAERIQDDVPASVAFMARSLTSIALTMDAKSYPPPHGSCINYGELGGRSFGVDKDRIKRNYVEVLGQFDGLFSFNLRTPASPAITPSGKRIYTLGLHDAQPDPLVKFIVERWACYQENKGSMLAPASSTLAGF